MEATACMQSDVLTALLARIDDAPDDMAARLVLADFLEEDGQVNEAEGHRILCELRRVPRYVFDFYHFDDAGNVWQFTTWHACNRATYWIRKTLVGSIDDETIEGQTASEVIRKAACLVGSCSLSRKGEFDGDYDTPPGGKGDAPDA